MLGELRWKTPVPIQAQIESTDNYLRRLAEWLREQERPTEYDLEAILAFGGLGVSERIFGFEGLISGYSAPSTHEILSAPTGTQKKIILGLHVSVDGTATCDVQLNKNSTLSFIAQIIDTHEEIIGSHRSGYITLDATDESIEIATVSGTADISYVGSYILVD